MYDRAKLLTRLTGLLIENGIGAERVTPRPRGGRLSGEPQREVEEVLDCLEADESVAGSLIYGNGCFAVGRYEAAAAVYRRIREEDPGHLDAGFNLGLAHLRLRQPLEAVDELSTVIEQGLSLAECYYQRGNAYDDLGGTRPSAGRLHRGYRHQARLPAGVLQSRSLAGPDGPPHRSRDRLR